MTQTKNSYHLKNYKIMGYNDDFTICECCGKSDLNGTVHILDMENQVVLHFGSTCAANANKYDSLDAAKRAKIKIQSIGSIIKRIKGHAIENTLNVMRKRIDFKTFVNTPEYIPEFDRLEKLYFNSNIDRAVFSFINADQILSDIGLVKDEYITTDEYKIMVNYSKLLIEQSGNIFSEACKSIRNTKEYRDAMFNSINKKEEITNKYPSLKYDPYISI